MTATDERTDAKAGFSTMCRRGDHTSCQVAKARCGCDCHGRNGQEPPAVKNRPNLAAVPAESGPVIQVVREDPPPSRLGRKPADEVYGEALASVRDEPGAWFRLATFPKPNQASGAKSALQKKFDGFTFAARRFPDGTSGLWVKYGEDVQV